MYGEAQKQTVTEQQPSEVWYHQQHNVAQNQEDHGNPIRSANSLDSLDCVSNSIQQARANSINHAPQEQIFASPQMLRINRSNSVR